MNESRRSASLWISGGIVAGVAILRATAMLLSDVSADWVEQFVDSLAGRFAHWVLLAAVLVGYAWHERRRRANRQLPTHTRVAPRGRVAHEHSRHTGWHSRSRANSLRPQHKMLRPCHRRGRREASILPEIRGCAATATQASPLHAIALVAR